MTPPPDQPDPPAGSAPQTTGDWTRLPEPEPLGGDEPEPPYPAASRPTSDPEPRAQTPAAPGLAPEAPATTEEIPAAPAPELIILERTQPFPAPIIAGSPPRQATPTLSRAVDGSPVAPIWDLDLHFDMPRPRRAAPLPPRPRRRVVDAHHPSPGETQELLIVTAPMRAVVPRQPRPGSTTTLRARRARQPAFTTPVRPPKRAWFARRAGPRRLGRPRRRSSPWRRAGLAALAVGLVGTGVGILWQDANRRTADALAQAPPPAPAPSIPVTNPAVADIPPDYLALYKRIGRRMNIDWRFLAAIGSVESDHGRHPETNIRNKSGCVGPMQLGVGGACGDFVSLWGVDGDNNGVIDATVPADAIATAARGLREGKGAPPINGSLAEYYSAACSYYGACADERSDYAATVLRTAALYGLTADATEGPG